MNVRKLSTMSQGTNNFLNKKRKNKNKLYKVYLSNRRRKKKKNQFSQVQTWRLRMKLLSKGIAFRSNTGFFGIWTLFNNCHIFTSK